MLEPRNAPALTDTTGRLRIGIAFLAISCIAAFLVARYLLAARFPETSPALWNARLFAALLLGGVSLLWGLL
jgi:hypothetical protein